MHDALRDVHLEQRYSSFGREGQTSRRATGTGMWLRFPIYQILLMPKQLYPDEQTRERLLDGTIEPSDILAETEETEIPKDKSHSADSHSLLDQTTASMRGNRMPQ